MSYRYFIDLMHSYSCVKTKCVYIKVKSWDKKEENKQVRKVRKANLVINQHFYS